MKRKGIENIAATLITVMLAVIIGIPILYTVTIGIVTPQITLTTVVNESIDVGTGTVNGTTYQLQHYPLDGTALTIINGTQAPLVDGTNFTYVAKTGLITWAADNSSGNISRWGQYWNASYQWRPETDATNRTLLSIVGTIILVLVIVGIIGFIALK